jgi:solute carrier family 25 protein 42
METSEAAADAARSSNAPPRRRLTMRQSLSGQPVPPKDSAAALLISGAAAGGVSKLLTAPIDRVKIMYQVSTSRPFTIAAGLSTAADIVRTAGVTALWRGNSIAVMRDIPYAALVFSSYSFFEEVICGRTGRQPDVWARSVAGGLAGAVSTCLTYPLDMLRARFGAEWAATPRYASYSQGVRDIVAREGVAALFAGLRPTLLGIMPYSALSFAAFETLKALLKARAEEAEARQPGCGALTEGELPVGQKMLAGGAAGLFAQTSTYPLHVVRRRMQAGHAGYTSTWQGLREIYLTEGIVGGLYKGLALTFVKGPLQSSIGFTVNDRCKLALRDWDAPDWMREYDPLRKPQR